MVSIDSSRYSVNPDKEARNCFASAAVKATLSNDPLVDIALVTSLGFTSLSTDKELQIIVAHSGLIKFTVRLNL